MAFLSKSYTIRLLWLFFFSNKAHASAEKTIDRRYKIIDPKARVDANFEHIRHQVMLMNNGKPYCSGTVIDNRFILTAAHCVLDKATNNFRNEPVTILANTNTLRENRQTEPIYRRVKKIVVHANYMDDGKGYDIAVLVLNHGLATRGSLVEKLDLAGPGESYDNVIAEVSGMGLDDVNFPIDGDNPETSTVYYYPKSLRYQNVSVLPDTKCSDYWPGGWRYVEMCGKLQTSFKYPGLCYKDSGSGLTYDGKVIGIVSYTHACNEGPGGAPSVYTRVSSYYDWIISVMRGRRDDTVMRNRYYYVD